MKKAFFSSLLSLLLTASLGTSAYAAKPAPATPPKTPLGIDVSYPQCGK